MEVKAAEGAKIGVAKVQAAYAKRRCSLIRKANEISVFCDVDIALVAFSPSGRVGKFCNKERFEEIIERYINLEPDKRYPHIGCLEWKLHKIRQLDHIGGDENKLTHIETQIKNLELQMKKSTLELGILQSNLKEFEPHNGEKSSLAEILHCEKNLKRTLQVVMDRKIMLINESYPSLGQTGLQLQQGQAPLAYETYPSVRQRWLQPQGQAPLAYETYPSFGQRRLLKRQGPAQAPLAYNYTGNQVQKKARKNLPSSITQFPLQYDPRAWPYYRFPNGASGSYAFNPQLATGYSAAIYHPGYPCLTPHTEIPPACPPIQYQPYWDPAAPSPPNWHLGMYENPPMHQAIIGNPAIPYVPYQQMGLMGAWGTPNLYRPIMPGVVDQQLGGLRSSSAQQMMRQDHIAPPIPNQQPGTLGGSFMDQSLMGDGTAPYVQFQQPGVLGNLSMGRLANDGSSGAQENPAPVSYHNYNISNTQNDASQPSISQLHQVDPDLVNLLCCPTYNTTPNMDVRPTLNSERVSSGTFFTSDIGSITNPTAGNGENINNGSNGCKNNGNIQNSSGIYGNNIIGNSDDPTQENPPPESPTDSFFLNCLLDEAAVENDKSQTAGNQEENLMEWDGFALAENLNLEDLDIIF